MMLHHLFLLALTDELSWDVCLWISFVCLRLFFDLEPRVFFYGYDPKIRTR